MNLFFYVKRQNKSIGGFQIYSIEDTAKCHSHEYYHTLWENVRKMKVLANFWIENFSF